MARAMQELGLQKKDLDTKKKKEDFFEEYYEELKAQGKPVGANPEVDDQIVSLRYRHYQFRTLQKINDLINARQQIKTREAIKASSLSQSRHQLISAGSKMRYN